MLAGLAVAGFLFSRPGSETGEAPRSGPSKSAVAVVNTPLPPATLPTPITAEPIPELPGLAGRAAADYRERARFPSWSRPIPDGRDLLLEERTPEPATSLPRSALPSLVVEMAKTGFVSPEPVQLRAMLRGEGSPIPAPDLRGEIRDVEDRFVAELAFRDDGLRGDEEARDHIYTARLDPGEDWRGAYLVSVVATTPEGDPRSVTSGFLYSVPLAGLTGRYRDEVVDGNLRIEAEIEVQQASRFHLEMTLSDATGTPCAWGQAASSLVPGRHWLPVTIYGLALREGRHDGPYTLRSVSLTTVDGIPNQKSELVRDAHQTRAYVAGDFHADPYDDPALLETADRLEGR